MLSTPNQLAKSEPPLSRASEYESYLPRDCVGYPFAVFAKVVEVVDEPVPVDD